MRSSLRSTGQNPRVGRPTNAALHHCQHPQAGWHDQAVATATLFRDIYAVEMLLEGVPINQVSSLLGRVAEKHDLLGCDRRISVNGVGKRRGN